MVSYLFCRNGLHKMKGENVAIGKNGSRECKACRYATGKKYREKRKEFQTGPCFGLTDQQCFDNFNGCLQAILTRARGLYTEYDIWKPLRRRDIWPYFHKHVYSNIPLFLGFDRIHPICSIEWRAQAYLKLFQTEVEYYEWRMAQEIVKALVHGTPEEEQRGEEMMEPFPKSESGETACYEWKAATDEVMAEVEKRAEEEILSNEKLAAIDPFFVTRPILLPKFQKSKKKKKSKSETSTAEVTDTAQVSIDSESSVDIQSNQQAISPNSEAESDMESSAEIDLGKWLKEN